MEKIKEFLAVNSGSGYGDGYDGSGDGDGDGYGFGSGGYGCGDGSGSGFGFGRGYGFGSGGYGCGDGSGYGSGGGSGYGFGSDGSQQQHIKAFCGKAVHQIDGIPTIIDRVHGNIAQGRILHRDLTTQKCYIVRNDRYFAHGDTVREAMTALTDKLFDGMPEEDRIAEFIKAHKWGEKYSTVDFYDWHHKLTGSCDMGRREFAASHGFKVTEDELLTVEEFIKLTGNSYGSGVIRKLEEAYHAGK